MEERNSQKLKKVWKKLSTFWYYHKWTVLVALVLTVLGVYGIVTAMAQKDIAFSGVLLNFVPHKETTLAADFAQYEQIDTDNYDVVLEDTAFQAKDFSQSNMALLQSLLSRINAGELDILGTDEDMFGLYANTTSGILADLRDYLDEETLAQLSDQIYYIDGAFLPVLLEAAASKDVYNSLEYPDPSRPEDMQEPIPVGIEISNCTRIRETYNLRGVPLYLGVVSNAQHPETAVHFIEFLLD